MPKYQIKIQTRDRYPTQYTVMKSAGTFDNETDAISEMHGIESLVRVFGGNIDGLLEVVEVSS